MAKRKRQPLQLTPDCTNEEAAFYAAAAIAMQKELEWIAASNVAMQRFMEWQACLTSGLVAVQQRKSVGANRPNQPRKKCHECKGNGVTKTNRKPQLNKRRRAVVV